MTSLRRQLTFWLLAPMLALWAINAWVTYQTAFEAANRVHDRTLLGSALAIAERITVVDDTVIVDLPYSALEMLESNIQSRVYYRVSHADASNITGYEDLPLPALQVELDKPFFYDAEYRGEGVRVAALSRHLYDESVSEPVLIQIAETAELRKAFSREILISSAIKELILILLAVTLVWLAVKRGLLPLYLIRNQVHGRDRSDLTAIDAALVPKEVKPLIDAINEHTARISQMICAQKQFVADAAHQLKTPLTLLRTQADFASRQNDMAAVNEVLDDLRKNTTQVSHLVDQLLALSRAEANATPDLAEIDLTELARRTTFEWLPLALKKSIDLGFDGEHAVKIMGHEFLLHELIRNLLDNALRFTPESGRVTVRVAQCDGRAVLSVEDSGSGIPAHERERVFDRFYQIPGRDTGGCGLGLSIVREICLLHDAAIELREGKNGTGTIAGIDFRLTTEKNRSKKGEHLGDDTS